MRRIPLSESRFDGSFHTARNPFEVPDNSLAEGSRNQLRGSEGWAPWKGMTSQGANTGSRLMRQVGSTYGGLADYISGATTIQGKGSIFEDVGRSRWFLGSGRPTVGGVMMPAGITASTNLQVSIAVNGVYSAATTFTAGLPQPSAADFAVIDTPGVGFVGLINGPVSVKLARLRLSTGARSVASPTSAVINPQNKTVRVTFPLAATGQDYWAVFFTQSGFGGVGLHYRGNYLQQLDISEALVAASSVDGIARSLEFDFRDGDLIPEVAYIDDYVPPAGTHAVRLENVMCVLGCYGDSTSAVTSSDPGTVGAISLPNFYESYKPRYLVYFPEQVIDVMARPTDQYAYVGHRNSITALQYIGVQDGPAVSVSMVWPDIGIAHPYNWTQVHGLLYVFPAKGGPVRMLANGSVDYTFARPVKAFMQNWTVDDTVVGWHPDTMSVVYFNNGIGLSFSLDTQQWSVVCYLADAGVSGSAISCVNSRGKLYTTINSGGAHTAYTWHEGATEMQITSFTNWKRGPKPCTIQELDIALETDSAANPLIVSVHRNLRKHYVRDARTTNGSSRIDSATANFDAYNIGDMVCVFGENIGGSGIDFLIGRIAAQGSPSASPSPSSSLSASNSASVSPSPSSSPSSSASPSSSVSSSRSASPSVSVSASPSSSGSASPSAS